MTYTELGMISVKKLVQSDLIEVLVCIISEKSNQQYTRQGMV